MISSYSIILNIFFSIYVTKQSFIHEIFFFFLMGGVLCLHYIHGFKNRTGPTNPIGLIRNGPLIRSGYEKESVYIIYIYTHFFFKEFHASTKFYSMQVQPVARLLFFIFLIISKWDPRFYIIVVQLQYVFVQSIKLLCLDYYSMNHVEIYLFIFLIITKWDSLVLYNRKSNFRPYIFRQFSLWSIDFIFTAFSPFPKKRFSFWSLSLHQR